MCRSGGRICIRRLWEVAGLKGGEGGCLVGGGHGDALARELFDAASGGL